jgi:hypothetical protein
LGIEVGNYTKRLLRECEKLGIGKCPNSKFVIPTEGRNLLFGVGYSIRLEADSSPLKRFGMTN